MADVSKFVIDANTYDVKDATARSEITSYVEATTELVNTMNELINKLPVYAYSNENITIKEL